MVQPELNAVHGQWAPATRPIAGVGKAATILAGITGLAALILGLAELHGYGLARDYLAGNGVGLRDLVDADNLDSNLSLLFLACTVATAVLLIVWTYQARVNAELICTAQHRRAKGWAIGGWFCPVVNLWFPAMIVEDIYRASMPSTRHDQVSFTGMPGVTLVRAWWTPFLLASIIAIVTSRSEVSLDTLQTKAIGTVFYGLLELAAVVPLAMIIRKVSTWQLEPKQY